VSKFVVQEREEPGTGRREFLVVNREDQWRPVASFDDRQEAQAHAERLNAGPLDWDEQEEAWKDDWDRDDDRWAGR
jgi:hypothetical protein